jgi:hypothetical protein
MTQLLRVEADPGVISCRTDCSMKKFEMSPILNRSQR